MQLWKMLISFVFCVVMWSALQVQAQWIQPSPSFTTTEMASQSTLSIQAKSKLSRGNCSYGQVTCRTYQRCIPASWDCDYYVDCTDGSDEDHCNQTVSISVSSSIQPSSTVNVQVSSSSQITCGYYQFRCNNRYQCVDRNYLCDGRYHCSDGSDEWYYNCVSSSIQPSSTVNVQVSSSSQIACRYYEFRCNNGNQCVQAYYLCDGWYHCFDGSDEWYSNCGNFSIQPSSTANVQVSSSSQITCGYYQFRCNNGYQCVHRNYLCDGWNQCSDGSDEWYYNCVSSSIQPSSTASLQVSSSSQIICGYYQFRCNNGYQCVHQYNLCDGWYHCSDGSDEWYYNCVSSSIQPSSTTASLQVSSSSQITCGYYQFRCNNGYQCVYRYYLCDGWYHCSDGSDEWHSNCVSSFIQPSSTTSSLQVSSSSQITCGYYQFRCNNGYQCVYRYYLCDGRYHCSDGSDEWYSNCVSFIQPSSTAASLQVSSSSSPTSRYCSSWEFNCRNGRCIGKGDVCNNYDNCGDGSDERRSICSGNVTICEHKIDLGFILDNSGSVGRQNFERMKLFVKDLTDFYKLGPDETRVSVMSYSGSANIHIAFSAYYSDKNQFDWAVNNILYTGGGTATAMALNMAYNTMFTSRYGARGSGFKKVLVILTDGHSNTGQVSGPARQLKNSGVVIFSVGIGQSLSMQELQAMASDPVNQRVITLDNFSQLDRLAEQMSSTTCNASNFKVFCDNDYMTAVFDRADLPKNVNIDRLYLRSRYCKAEWNSTHVIVKTPLTGCGTVFSKNDQTLFFRNVLSEEEGVSRGVGVITRDYLFKANLTCTYPRKRTVGSFNFAPAKERLFVNVGGQGNFTLTLDVFKSVNYRQSYTPQDYPVLKSLSDNLYIQYSINTSNFDLVVRAEACRATPTNKPYDTPQYVFIADSCDKDETIRHYTYGMSSVQRFSMQAFRFLSEHRFVYLHCDLVVCYRYDYNSTCARSTLCPRRYRRDVDRPAEDVSGTYPLSFGPIMKGEESADKNTGGVLLNQ